MDNKSVQSLLKSVDRDTLLMALRGADSVLTELFLGNMSRRAAQDLRDELEIMGPRPRAEVERAQEDIVQTALSLQEEGAPLPTCGWRRRDGLIHGRFQTVSGHRNGKRRVSYHRLREGYDTQRR